MTSPLPKRLRDIRKKRGITQEELGQKLGMESGSASARISQYETGKHAPDYTTVKRISAVLEITVAYFYCDDDTLANIIIEASSHSETTKLDILKILEGIQKQ
ncbi:helix-turn-helix transcriptional regulator [Vibrio sp. RE88]|uniref:helix-turn-helix domain-containing protein n=1 Tax=Vibrio sp. RE88 TaxID=2607610 RepID=UPI001493C3A5|nr:helix-turn-helix transcriptional regulator [Vibrio sp. RE88]NOH62352.1 helix-turn-helix transcriptional regulator [Vibrio sp. RE88]